MRYGSNARSQNPGEKPGQSHYTCLGGGRRQGREVKCCPHSEEDISDCTSFSPEQSCGLEGDISDQYLSPCSDASAGQVTDLALFQPSFCFHLLVTEGFFPPRRQSLGLPTKPSLFPVLTPPINCSLQSPLLGPCCGCGSSQEQLPCCASRSESVHGT